MKTYRHKKHGGKIEAICWDEKLETKDKIFALADKKTPRTEFKYNNSVNMLFIKPYYSKHYEPLVKYDYIIKSDSGIWYLPFELFSFQYVEEKEDSKTKEVSGVAEVDKIIVKNPGKTVTINHPPLQVTMPMDIYKRIVETLEFYAKQTNFCIGNATSSVKEICEVENDKREGWYTLGHKANQTLQSLGLK